MRPNARTPGGGWVNVCLRSAILLSMGPNATRSAGKTESAVPLFRWAGGKQRLVKLLADSHPTDHEDKIYYETFLGAASLFINGARKSSRLSDLNPHLIACYRQVRGRPRAVARSIRRHFTRDSDTY